MAMAMLREALLQTLLLSSLTLTSGAAIMLVHGLLMCRRLRGSQTPGECVPRNAMYLGVAAGFFSLLLLTQAKAVPWERLSTLALLVATAPALLAWFRPPEEHVEASSLCQIGRGSAYSHYYGYLRLMQGPNCVRSRLQKFSRAIPAGLLPDELLDFYSDAAVVLTPSDGKYPADWSELPGVGSKRGDVSSFQCHVGGNKREYGKFSVHEVTSGAGRRLLVALDKVAALGTLRKLRDHGPANLSRANHEKQMQDMMDELEKIVKTSSYLKGKLVVVRYDPEEDVGDAIMAAIDSSRASDQSS